ncbi:MAG: hypothetical protein IJ153_01740 [Clostridia bacterium]|nr:hypothetical protein [Clostridia bacterium]
MKGFKKVFSVLLALLLAVGLVSVNTVKANAESTEIEYTIQVEAPKAGTTGTDTDTYKIEKVKFKLTDDTRVVASEYAAIEEAIGLKYDSTTTKNITLDADKKIITIQLTVPVVGVQVKYVDDDGETVTLTDAKKTPVVKEGLIYYTDALSKVGTAEAAKTDGKLYSKDPVADEKAVEVTSKTAKAAVEAKDVTLVAASVLGGTGITVYSIGELKTLKITFDANGKEFKKNLNPVAEVAYGQTLDDAFQQLKDQVVGDDVTVFFDYDNTSKLFLGFAEDKAETKKSKIYKTADDRKEVTLTEDAKYYALWDTVESTYDIVYDANDSFLAKQNQTSEIVKKNEQNVDLNKDRNNVTLNTGNKASDSVKIKLNPWTIEGFTFSGWNTMPDGTGYTLKEGDSVKDIPTLAGIESFKKYHEAINDVVETVDKADIGKTVVYLFAQWSGKDYTITYIPGMGNANKTQAVTEGEVYTVDDSFEKTGYSLVGFIPLKKADVDKIIKGKNTNLDDFSEVFSVLYQAYVDGSSVEITKAQQDLLDGALVAVGANKDSDNETKIGRVGKAEETKEVKPATQYVLDYDTVKEYIETLFLTKDTGLTAGADYKYGYTYNSYYFGVWSKKVATAIEYVNNGTSLKKVVTTVDDDSKAPEVAQAGYTLTGWKLVGKKEGKVVINGKEYPYTLVKEAVWTSDTETQQSVYRLYNTKTGEHLYTTDENEYKVVGALAAWNQEGAVFTAPVEGTPVYRVYNPTTGEHHYTSDATEVAYLAKIGWTNEGVKFNSASEGTPVFRLFNPKGTGTNSHLLTTDEVEKAYLLTLGWVDEKVAFYVTK